KFGAAGIAMPQDPITLRLAGNVLTAGMAAHYLDTAAALARLDGHDWGFRKLPAQQWEDRAARLLAPYHGAGDPVRVEEIPPPRPAPAPHPTAAMPAAQPLPQPGGLSTKFEREAGATFS